MNLNKLAISVALVLGASSGAYAEDAIKVGDQGHGKVTFTGSIIDAPCSIDSNSIDQTIEMGAVSNVSLADGGSSTPKPFEVRLENCSLTTAKTVKTTFNGTAGSAGLLAITGASGAGIALSEGNGTAVVLGTATAGQLLSVGTTDATLSFRASLKGNGGAVSTIIPGEFSSVVNFLLTYN